MSHPEMVPVDSSSIEMIGYVEDDQELYIRVLNGGLYVYKGVAASAHERLIQAQSHGTYFNREIKPYYAFRQVA